MVMQSSDYGEEFLLSLEAKCMTCRKEYRLEASDPYYPKLKMNLTKLYICKSCSTAMKEEAISSTGLNPGMLDPKGHDKLVP
jgi:DNA-directed RNA polymerase subunit RPC12/RpoP